MAEPQTVKGVISKVYVNEFDDGNSSVSFKLRNDPLYYRTGKNRFAGIVEEGKAVEFKAAVVSEKAAKVLGTPRKSAASAAPAEAQAPRNGFGSNDAAIRYQSSRKDALEMVRLVLDNEAIKLPAKQGAILPVLEALVDRYTALFFADIETKGAIGRVQPAKAEKKSVEVEEADPEAESEAEGEVDEEGWGGTD